MDPQQERKETKDDGSSRADEGSSASQTPAATPPNSNTVITPNQRRMITTAGQIREVEPDDTQEQYEQQQQQPPQSEYQHIVDATQPQYYESAPDTVVTREAPTAPTQTTARLVEKQNGHVVAQTVYVVQREEPEMLRYHHPQNMRYEERYQRHYQYQQNPHVVKTELEAHQAGQQQIIYEAETQEAVVEGTEPKTQYTNLEPMQTMSSSSYYLASGYGSGNVAYVQGPSNKEEYYTLHSSSPNPVLYKSKVVAHLIKHFSNFPNFSDDPSLNSTIPGKQLHYTSLSAPQPIYENASVQPGSPSSQPIYTYCKTEPQYWSGVDYNGANVRSPYCQPTEDSSKNFQAFANGTTIVIENGPGGAEYGGNTHQWIQEGFDPQIVGTSTEVKECVGCSNTYGPMRRDPGSGHYICNTCEGNNQRIHHQRPMHRGQKPKPAVVRIPTQIIFLPYISGISAC